MSPNPTWTRRNFVSTLGLTGAAAALAPHLSASTPLPLATPAKATPFLSFIGCSNPGTHQDHIETFVIRNGIWSNVSHPRIPSAAPRALATHPTLPILYVAHSLDTHANLPRGSVSAYAIKADGRHTLLSHEPLALSATNPNHLAISPDGRTLLASSASGGSYNFFSLSTDGQIQPTPFPLKQTGSGPHPLQTSASPHAAVFAPSGAAYATDLGADRLNHIAVRDGIPTIESRLSFEPGSGPAHLALHPSGKLLVVACSLRPGLTVVPIDARSGQLETPLHRTAIDARAVGPIAFSPEGDRLHAATDTGNRSLRLSTFRFSPTTGRLTLIDRKIHSFFPMPTQMTLSEDQLHLVSQTGASIVNAWTGASLGDPIRTSHWAVSIASMPLSRV